MVGVTLLYKCTQNLKKSNIINTKASLVSSMVKVAPINFQNLFLYFL